MTFTTGSAGQAEVHRPRPEAGQTDVVPQGKKHVSQPSSSADVVVPVEELPIPTMGFPAFWYKLTRLFGSTAPPPKLNKKEAKLKRYNDSLIRLNELADQVKRATIGFFGVSGSAATTTSVVNCAAIFSEKTRTIVAASDFNPASGTAAARLGKGYDDTLTVRGLKRLLRDGAIQNPTDLTGRLRPTVNGVRVLGANNLTTESGAVEATVLAEMLKIIQRVIEFHFVDTANDTSSPAMRKILEMCDIPVFTANVAEHKSLLLLGNAMEVARNSTDMRYKTDNSVVIISGFPKKGKLEDYQLFLNLVDNDEAILEARAFNGQMLPVHQTDALARNARVNLDKLERDTIQEYLDILIAILEQILLIRANQQKGVA